MDFFFSAHTGIRKRFFFCPDIDTMNIRAETPTPSPASVEAVATGLNDGEVALDLLVFIPPLIGWIVAVVMIFIASNESRQKRVQSAFNRFRSRFQNSATEVDQSNCVHYDRWDGINKAVNFGMPRQHTNWLSIPRAVVTKSTASSVLSVAIVEIVLLGLVLLDVAGNKSTSRMLLWPLIYLPLEYFATSAFKSVDIYTGKVDPWAYVVKSFSSVLVAYAGWCFITQSIGIRDRATLWYPLGGFFYTGGLFLLTLYKLFGGAQPASDSKINDRTVYYLGERYSVLTAWDIILWCLTLSAIALWVGFALATDKGYDSIAFTVFPLFLPLTIHFFQNLFRMVAPAKPKPGKHVRKALFNVLLIMAITTTVVLMHVQLCQQDSFKDPTRKVKCPSSSRPSDEKYWNHNGVYFIISSCVVTWLLLFVGVLDTTVASPETHYPTECMEAKASGTDQESGANAYTYSMSSYNGDYGK